MPRMIFVNLPVTDLPASIRFYEACWRWRSTAANRWTP